MLRPPFRVASATWGVLILAALALSACDQATGRNAVDSTGATRRASRILTGAGATFPFPLYARWFSAYARHTGVRINYQPIGSGAGIRQVLANTVDFGATDVPMSANELATAPPGGVVHVPTVMGAVAIVYNLPELPDSLRLTGDVVADLFLGRITRWDDARLAALNPRLNLPAREVLVVHRADGSGTTYILSDFLSRTSAAWASGPGRGKDLHWSTGFGAKGNDGVASQLRQLPGSIGYLEVVYAQQNRLAVAQLRNRAGTFVAPAPEAIRAAAIDRPLTDDPHLTLADSDAPGAYPIAAYTWVIFDRVALGRTRRGEIEGFLRWALSSGDTLARELGYVPLPPAIAVQALARLAPAPATP